MREEPTQESLHKIITIPNLLSMFRLLLVPVFCWTYLGLENLWLTIGLLALSGLTDIADGYIARRFHMISDFGKALDPVADKITQIAMLTCLIIRIPILIPVLALLVTKELVDGIHALYTVKKTGRVLGAEWHGKLSTVLIYSTIVLHALWQAIPALGEIPAWLTIALSVACIIAMLLSMILYIRRNLNTLREFKAEQEASKS